MPKSLSHSFAVVVCLVGLVFLFCFFEVFFFLIYFNTFLSVDNFLSGRFKKKL